MTSRVALVTGGTGGIGTAIVKRLAGMGHKVATNYRNEEKARAWQEKMKADGYDVAIVKGDVTSPQEAEAMVHEVEATLGPIDILVNNAGITRDATLRNMDRAQWDAVIGVNLDSVFNLCRHAVEGMQARGFGRIVNISSVSGQTGNFGQVNYAAAKAGLHGFSMSLAREVARKGVTVNSVSPGYVETPMTNAMPAEVRERTVASVPVGRIGQPDDIARAVAFLAADDAGYITGANLPVNGGLFMSF